MNHEEHNQQSALFAWAALQGEELRWMYATPNAARRSPRQGAWMKAEGMKSGVWDIFLPYPNAGYHGMYIEMKTKGNKLTENQIKFRDDLLRYYWFFVCTGDWRQAAEAIKTYLAWEEPRF